MGITIKFIFQQTILLGDNRRDQKFSNFSRRICDAPRNLNKFGKKRFGCWMVGLGACANSRTFYRLNLFSRRILFRCVRLLLPQLGSVLNFFASLVVLLALNFNTIYFRSIERINGRAFANFKMMIIRKSLSYRIFPPFYIFFIYHQFIKYNVIFVFF